MCQHLVFKIEKEGPVRQEENKRSVILPNQRRKYRSGKYRSVAERVMITSTENRPLGLVRCSTLDLFTQRLSKSILAGVLNMHAYLCVCSYF